MPFVRAASVAALPAGSMVQAEIEDELYLICNVEGTLHAMEGRCPHAGGPLAQGALHGHTVVCPWHAWEFDCRTGQTDFNPHIRIRTLALKTVGDEVWIEV